MIITLLSQKGGTGKSTLAVHLATHWAARGRRVLLVDTDPQANVMDWAEWRSGLNLANPTVVAVGDNVREAVTGLHAGYDITLIDTAGRRSNRVVAALGITTMAVMPCQPLGFDVQSLRKTAALVAEIQELRPGLHAGIVVNQMTETVTGRAGAEALRQWNVPVLGTVWKRIGFAEAVTAGQGICERDPRNKGNDEIGSLAAAIEAAHHTEGGLRVA